MAGRSPWARPRASTRPPLRLHNGNFRLQMHLLVHRHLPGTVSVASLLSLALAPRISCGPFGGRCALYVGPRVGFVVRVVVVAGDGPDPGHRVSRRHQMHERGRVGHGGREEALGVHGGGEQGRRWGVVLGGGREMF